MTSTTCSQTSTTPPLHPTAVSLISATSNINDLKRKRESTWDGETDNEHPASKRTLLYRTKDEKPWGDKTFEFKLPIQPSPSRELVLSEKKSGLRFWGITQQNLPGYISGSLKPFPFERMIYLAPTSAALASVPSERQVIERFAQVCYVSITPRVE